MYIYVCMCKKICFQCLRNKKNGTLIMFEDCNRVSIK